MKDTDTQRHPEGPIVSRLSIALLIVVWFGHSAFSQPLAQIPIDTPASGERHFMILFGGQGDRFRPQTAHTWATFVAVDTTGSSARICEEFTISWLPVNMPVKPYRLRPEEGRNYGLHETLQIMSTGRHDLSMWGPYEIVPRWYTQAKAYKCMLDSGAIKYQTLDGNGRRPHVNHCVHAVTYTDPRLRELSAPILWYGDLITRRVANMIGEACLLIQPECTHDWILMSLGIQQYELKRRTLNEPILRFLR